MHTTWCLTVAFLTPWVVGAPALWLFRGGRALQRPDWLWAPFVALAVIICVLQNLAIYADLPLHLTAPWFWAAVAGGWVVMLATRSGRASLRVVPVRVLALAGAVYLIQAVGILAHGADRYRGNLISDQYSYVGSTQFLMDLPHSTHWDQVGQRPWLLLPISLKTDRLAQSVVHGFLAETAGADALDLFFPTIYLGAALMVPAVRAFASRVGLFGVRASAAAAASGLVPGVTAILIACYLSQALFAPVLFAFLAAVLRVARGRAALVPAVLTFALGFSLYTEFTPLLVGVGAVALGVGWLWCGLVWKRLLVVIACLAAAPMLNPAAVGTIPAIHERIRDQGMQMGTQMTWGYMAASIWLDQLRCTDEFSVPSATARFVFVAGCYGLALAGWYSAGRRAWRDRRGRAGVAAAVALLLLPLVGMCASARYPTYKALGTAAPLLVLGIALWGQRPIWQPRAWVFGAVAAWFIFLAVSQPTVRKIRIYTEARDAWNDPGLTALTEYLRAEPPTNVVVVLGEGRDSWVVSGAVLYYARHHRIWIASPQRIWLEELGMFPTPQLSATASGLRPGALVVADTTTTIPAGVTGEVVRRTDHYVLLRVTTGVDLGYASGGR